MEMVVRGRKAGRVKETAVVQETERAEEARRVRQHRCAEESLRAGEYG